MSIQSTTELRSNHSERKYPYLGKMDNGLVVLFTGKGKSSFGAEGVVVATGKSDRKLGEIHKSLAECNFNPLHPSEKVILSNFDE